MKFIKSLFLAIVCVCMYSFGIFDAYAVSCAKGQYSYLSWCHACPYNCYCPYATDGYQSQGYAGCDTANQTVWLGAYSYPNNGDAMYVYACPKAYPLTERDGRQSKNDCYALSIACSSGGTYIKAGTGHCNTMCPAGYKCPGGTTYEKVFYSDEKGKEACPKGHYSKGGTKTCTACGKGTYTSTTGTVTCGSCGKGRCPALDTSDSCVESGATRCVACPNGFYSDSNPSTGCKKCETGPVEYETIDGNSYPTKCGTCPDGTYLYNSQCLTCPAGYACKGGGKTKCLPPTYASGTGNTECSVCNDKVTANGSGEYTMCEPCPEEYSYPYGNHTQCKTCQPGNQMINGECIEHCPKGYYCPNPGQDPIKCDPNKGEYTSNNDPHDKCDNCSARGLYAMYTSKCIKVGLSSRKGGGCTKWEYQDLSVGCDECLYGDRYQDDENSACKSCPTYGVPEGAKFERVQNASNKGIASCRYTIDKDGCKQSWIYNPTTNSYVVESMTAHVNYYVSRTSGVSGTRIECKKCSDTNPATPYSDGGPGGKEQCHACAAGSCIYSGICHHCSAGYYCPAGANGEAQNCDITASGNYGVEICGIDTFSTEGATACTHCAPGYSTSSGESCHKKSGEGCYKASACKPKKAQMCYIPKGDNVENCYPWADCIIEGQIDRTVIKRF